MLEKTDNRLFYIKLFAAALIILGARLWVINNFGSSVPYWDQWNTPAAFLFLPWFNDTLIWSDLFAPHNEHRVFFTRILDLLLLFLNEKQWDPLFGMLFNALLFSFIAVILILMLNSLLGNRVQNLILFSVTLLWSIPSAWESILGSFNSQYYFMFLFSLITLWGLLNNNFSFKWWIGVIFAIAAIFTMASGFFILLVLIVIQLYLIIIDIGNRKKHLPTLIISITIIGFSLMLIVRVPHHEVLIVKNIGEFLLAFGKTLAWPWVKTPWLSLVLYLPFLIFVFRILWLRKKPSQGELFVLALGGWVILQSAATAYARGAGGVGPTSRYMDLIVVGIIVNLLAFHFIIQASQDLHSRIKSFLKTLACLWKPLVILGIAWLTVMETWPDMQQKRVQSIEQLKNTHEFIRTGELSVLQNKPFLDIPYPVPERLAGLLAEPQLRKILPHTLTVPSLLKFHHKDSAFIVNGFYHTTGKYKNEDTFGSYNHLGDAAVGRFESELIQPERGFIEIPVAGYLGTEKGLTLQLEIEGQADPIIITPNKLPRESWVSCYVRTPKQPFRLVAIDNSPNIFGWFAFAMPRSIGTLSLITIWVLEKGWLLFFIGISLLYISFCSRIINK
jgi:hypothetical protein